MSKYNKFKLLSISSIFGTVLFISNLVHANDVANLGIDINAINSQPIINNYSNAISKSKDNNVLFFHKDSNNTIEETKEYGHSQRNINISGAIGNYSLSKRINGSITDDKNNRTSSIPVVKF